MGRVVGALHGRAGLERTRRCKSNGLASQTAYFPDSVLLCRLRSGAGRCGTGLAQFPEGSGGGGQTISLWSVAGWDAEAARIVRSDRCEILVRCRDDG